MYLYLSKEIHIQLSDEGLEVNIQGYELNGMRVQGLLM